MRRVMAVAEHMGPSFHRKGAENAKVAKQDFYFFATLVSPSASLR